MMRKSFTTVKICSVLILFGFDPTLAEAAKKKNATANTSSARVAYFETVKPALRDPQRWGNARCNDGTPFTFEVRPGAKSSKVWVIYLQGGGLCDDYAIPCSKREGSVITTSPFPDGAQSKFSGRTGIFSLDPQMNPHFESANHVFARYCSSDLWSGNTTKLRRSSGSPHGWYFSGRHNFKAMMEVLKETYGLDDADRKTQILLSGGSAGAHGAAANADQVVKLMPKTSKSGRLKVAIDAGWVFDWDDPQHRIGLATVPDRDVMRRFYDRFKTKLNPKCTSAQINAGGHPGDCYFGEVSHKYLTAPRPVGLGLKVLVQQNSIDRVYMAGQHRISYRDTSTVNRWRSQLLDSFKRADVKHLYTATEQKIGGLGYHGILIDDRQWHYGAPGFTFRDLILNFWNDVPMEPIIYHEAP